MYTTDARTYEYKVKIRMWHMNNNFWNNNFSPILNLPECRKNQLPGRSSAIRGATWHKHSKQIVRAHAYAYVHSKILMHRTKKKPAHAHMHIAHRRTHKIFIRNISLYTKIFFIKNLLPILSCKVKSGVNLNLKIIVIQGSDYICFKFHPKYLPAQEK